MISHYHPGVYGKGEWTCCKAKVKDETGCHETTLLPGYRRNTTDSLSECISISSSISAFMVVLYVSSSI